MKLTKSRNLLKLLCAVVVMFINSAQAEQAAPFFVEGEDFRRIDSSNLDVAVELEQLQQVADIEVFYWYGCEPCYQVEQALSEYLQGRPQIKIVRIPLVAHLKWRPQAYIQPLMEQLTGDLSLPSSSDIYQACLSDCSVFDSYPAIKQWLQQQSSLVEIPYIDEAQIWQAEKNYRKRADSFSISQVPTIIIREAYAVDANSAKSVSRMIDIIDYLLTTKVN